VGHADVRAAAWARSARRRHHHAEAGQDHPRAAHRPHDGRQRGSSYENRANLADAFFAQIVRKYEGTRLGRQELNAELLDDVPGALWNRARLEELRWPAYKSVPELTRIVVAIDPAVTSGEDADETGIIVAGKDASDRGYVLANRSGHHTPTEWAKLARLRLHGHTLTPLRKRRNQGSSEACRGSADANYPDADASIMQAALNACPTHQS
jgi:phage terminase large subunit-like protein